jgi:hypothetical protein
VRSPDFAADRLRDASGLIFPSVRDILWDRHYLSRGLNITVPDVLPMVYLSVDCIAEMLSQQNTGGGPMVATLCLDDGGTSAEITPPSQPQPRVFVAQTAAGTSGSAKKLAISLPIRPQEPGYVGACSQGLVQNLAKSLMLSPEFALKSVMRCSGALRGPSADSAAGLRLRCELLLPNCSFQYKQLKPLPLFSSPLASALSQPVARDLVSQASSYIDGNTHVVRSLSGAHAECSIFGYVTLNQTRKVVLLQEGDGNLGCIPVVGVWVRLPDSFVGGAGGATNPASPAFLSDFQLWSACVRFVHTSVVRDRALVAAGTFLLVAVHRGRFHYFECTILDGALGLAATDLPSSAQQQYSRFEFEVPLPSYGRPLAPVLGKFRRCYDSVDDSFVSSVGAAPARCGQSPPMDRSGLPAHDEVLEVSTLMPTPRSSLNLPAPTLLKTSFVVHAEPDLVRRVDAGVAVDPAVGSSYSDMDDSYSDSADESEASSSGSVSNARPAESLSQTRGTARAATSATAAVAPPRDLCAPAAKALLITKDLHIAALEKEISVLRRMLWKQYNLSECKQWLTSAEDEQEEARLRDDICGGAPAAVASYCSSSAPAQETDSVIGSTTAAANAGGGDKSASKCESSESSGEPLSDEEEEEEEVVVDPFEGANIPHHAPPSSCLLTDHIFHHGVVISEPSSICIPSEVTVSIIHKENPLLTLHAGDRSHTSSVNSSFCGSIASAPGAASSSSSSVAAVGADDENEGSDAALRSSLVYENHNSTEEVSNELLVDDICKLYQESESVINIELKYVNLKKAYHV